MRYLYKNHFDELEGYCISRCKKVVNEHSQVHIWYYRGQYKGYSYVLKVIRTNKQPKVPFHIVYNMLKRARAEVEGKYHHKREYVGGISDSIYDCMYYLNSLD